MGDIIALGIFCCIFLAFHSQKGLFFVSALPDLIFIALHGLEQRSVILGPVNRGGNRLEEVKTLAQGLLT